MRGQSHFKIYKLSTATDSTYFKRNFQQIYREADLQRLPGTAAKQNQAGNIDNRPHDVQNLIKTVFAGQQRLTQSADSVSQQIEIAGILWRIFLFVLPQPNGFFR